MNHSQVLVAPVAAENAGAAAAFLTGWVISDDADAREYLASHPADRGARTLGITVGPFDAYGPAQRLYVRRGYVPDGRGACQGQQPIRQGARVNLDHDVIIWLTKDLTLRRPDQ